MTMMITIIIIIMYRMLSTNRGEQAPREDFALKLVTDGSGGLSLWQLPGPPVLKNYIFVITNCVECITRRI